MWKKHYSQLLKEIFALYNINCCEFADEIKVSAATIRQWQTGRNFPSKAVLDVFYPALETKINNSTNPSLTAQVTKYISKIPSVSVPSTLDAEKTGEWVVSTLKLCYANSKALSNPFSPPKSTYLPTGRIQAIVFDFDGTLTKGCDSTTWESIWTALGYNVEECRALHKQFDSKEITHEEWCKLTTDKFIAKGLNCNTMAKIASTIQLIDGCQETFEKLKSYNIKIYIVSGSILTLIQDALGGLTRYVDSIKANDFRFSKDGFLKDIIGTKYDFEGKASFICELAENLRIATADILFVGNSYNDKFAYTSGAKTLCINPKYTDPSDNKIWHKYIQECKNLTQILPVLGI